MGARKAEVREDRVLAGAIVPSAAPGGRETGIAWALRGLSLASHAGAIAAAIAVAGPQPAAVIEAYTVEIVFSDSVAGGHGEGTDMPSAPSPGAAGASPAYRSRGDTSPLVPPGTRCASRVGEGGGPSRSVHGGRGDGRASCAGPQGARHFPVCGRPCAGPGATRGGRGGVPRIP